MATAATALRAERDYLRRTHPDPATLLLICMAPSSRLWERQRSHEDFLTLRVGTGTIPASVTVRDQMAGNGADGASQLTDAPVVLPLPECGSIGLVLMRAPPTGAAVRRVTSSNVWVSGTARERVRQA